MWSDGREVETLRQAGQLQKWSPSSCAFLPWSSLLPAELSSASAPREPSKGRGAREDFTLTLRTFDDDTMRTFAQITPNMDLRIPNRRKRQGRRQRLGTKNR